MAGTPGQANVRNRVVAPADVSGRYDGYSDGSVRELAANHFNMEEVVSTLPLLDYHGEQLNLGELIQRGWDDQQAQISLASAENMGR